MDNQHRKVTGYRELNDHDIALMNEIKSVGNEHLATILTKVSDELEHRYQSGDFYQNESQYKVCKFWFSIFANFKNLQIHKIRNRTMKFEINEEQLNIITAGLAELQFKIAQPLLENPHEQVMKQSEQVKEDVG